MDIDLGNNGGGSNNNNAAAVVPRSPADRADPQLMELPPFTWLRAAPYIVAVLAGVALLAVGVVRMVSLPCPAPAAGADGENKPASSKMIGGCDDLGSSMLAVVGMVLVILPAYLASFALNCDCRVPRLDQADE